MLALDVKCRTNCSENWQHVRQRSSQNYVFILEAWDRNANFGEGRLVVEAETTYSMEVPPASELQRWRHLASIKVCNNSHFQN